jgi:hypothetical protein
MEQRKNAWGRQHAGGSLPVNMKGCICVAFKAGRSVAPVSYYAGRRLASPAACWPRERSARRRWRQAGLRGGRARSRSVGGIGQLGWIGEEAEPLDDEDYYEERWFDGARRVVLATDQYWHAFQARIDDPENEAGAE